MGAAHRSEQVKRTTRRGFALAVLIAMLAVIVPAHAGSAGAARGPMLSKPRVLGVHPATAHGKGGSRFLVLGSGFTTDTKVTVGGRPARVVELRNPGALIAIAPPGIRTEIVRAVTGSGASAANGRSRLTYVNRVLIVGDSLGIDLGWGFTPDLGVAYGLRATDLSKESSGLVRDDYYDWPDHLRADIAAVRPDVVVTLFGTNDQQPLPTPTGQAQPATAAWNTAYAIRVRAIASIVRAAGATLVWMGLPRMGPNSVLSSIYVADVVRLDRSVLSRLHGAVFVDAWSLFTTPGGAYTPYVEIAPRTWVLGHAQDGTHLTPAGAAVMDARGMAALQQLLLGR